MGIKIIEGNDDVREKKCAMVINTILKEYDCVMIPVFTIVPGQIEGKIDVIAKPRKGVPH